MAWSGLVLRAAWQARYPGAMTGLRVALLGSPRIEVAGMPLRVDTRKAVALLAYLACSGRRHGRDQLAVLLWPDADDAHARAALRRTLSALNHALGSAARVGGDRAGLELIAPGMDLGVRRFRRAAASRGGAAPRRLPGRLLAARRARVRGLAARRGRGAPQGTGGRAPAAGRGVRRPGSLAGGDRRRGAVAGARLAPRAGPPPAHAAVRVERPARRRHAPVPRLRARARPGARRASPRGDRKSTRL